MIWLALAVIVVGALWYSATTRQGRIDARRQRPLSTAFLAFDTSTFADRLRTAHQDGDQDAVSSLVAVHWDTAILNAKNSISKVVEADLELLPDLMGDLVADVTGMRVVIGEVEAMLAKAVGTRSIAGDHAPPLSLVESEFTGDNWRGGLNDAFSELLGVATAMEMDARATNAVDMLPTVLRIFRHATRCGQIMLVGIRMVDQQVRPHDDNDELDFEMF